MTKHTAAISTPKHLRKESAAFFKSVTNEYVLDEHHVILLTKDCESLADAAVGASRAVGEAGYRTEPLR
jgi:hypothetical protein